MSRVPAPAAAAVAAAFLCYATTGCLSNEYTIPRAELTRLAETPAPERGSRVRVVQDVGMRRAPALPPGQPPAMVPYDAAGYAPGHQSPGGVHGGVNVYVSPHRRHGGFGVGSYSPGAPTGSTPGAAPGGWRGSGATAAPVAAPTPKPSSGGGGWRSSGGSGGGGGGKGEGLAVLAVVIVAVAAFAAVGFAVTEGARYDGWADVAPDQPIYLRDSRGGQRQTTLTQLTTADVANATEATVKDDEGYGLSLAGRAPLDRRGLAFKVDVGQLQTALRDYDVAGLAGNIQLGYFPWRKVGLLATLSLTGGNDELGKTFVRHSTGLELQWFPLQLGPLHLGPYANGGHTVVQTDTGSQSGPSFGGGALLELELTTRLAITFRAGWSSALLPPGMGEPPGDRWSPSAVFSGGLAIY